MLHGENVLSFAAVSLKFETQFTHPFSAFAWFDSIVLLAFGSCFGTCFLDHLLLASLTFLLKAFVDVNGATLVVVTSVRMTRCISTLAIVDAEAI